MRFPRLLPLVLGLASALAPFAQGEPLKLHLRARQEVAPNSGRYHAITRQQNWQPQETAIVVCDMWDTHTCPNAAVRVAQMAPRMNEVLKAARSRGVLIIHCPSGTMEFYKDHPGRKLAQQAPPVKTERPLERWCYLDENREPPMPVDTSDGGCDCERTWKKGDPVPWTRQIATLQIKDGDAITDSAEAYYLMRQRGIQNVIVMGVHTNMCVLGRPFSIRQMVYQGMNVALMRDLTDTMYNPQMPPFVSHFTGTDLVVEHIEKYWCPTLTSGDFLEGGEYRFPDDKRPHMVVLLGEEEYNTAATLPKFAAEELGKDFRVSLVFLDEKSKASFPGIEVIDDADVLLVSVRRRPLPKAELGRIRSYVAAGKPVLGIRTASHAFHLRNQTSPEGLDQWPELDAAVFGGSYSNHYGHKLQSTIWPLPEAKDHPILKGIPAAEFPGGSGLYQTSPLKPGATELLRGKVEGVDKPEPVAWTFTRADGGLSFYTSLGHPDDFALPEFRTLLKNALAHLCQRKAGTDTRQERQ
jgi:nicotinamidase-related amidase/type 1 glutamine amidotransferase